MALNIGGNMANAVSAGYNIGNTGLAERVQALLGNKMQIKQQGVEQQRNTLVGQGYTPPADSPVMEGMTPPGQPDFTKMGAENTTGQKYKYKDKSGMEVTYDPGVPVNQAKGAREEALKIFEKVYGRTNDMTGQTEYIDPNTGNKIDNPLKIINQYSREIMNREELGSTSGPAVDAKAVTGGGPTMAAPAPVDQLAPEVDEQEALIQQYMAEYPDRSREEIMAAMKRAGVI